ncbi:ankyrin repeat protein, putative [Trichomonas vaginalis G3]|uniref:Ankyrin repeat protein, putative n=1 Tax=Trichomonas vaginalis (strain ATCC PRA-98 / G3) TaxID=412133 RepID=A2EDU3_TRIV3|nr:spectrin binding [Trichomonas vaginalis G3]EAY09159.1 ankyrin repeat protein, putative [Trichomonas vaginalis G3]KAI5487052.1 spectrin binding [Trichomonas vaginalis G3]|eukprot:XP_001321382.1 ankyrin repeat protein [Trichomonas vaginalis G3]
MIPYNNCYTKSYLSLAKLISDEYHVTEVNDVKIFLRFLFYKEYGINLDKSTDFEKIQFRNLDILTEDTIYRAITYNNLEAFISFTERAGFNKDQTLESSLFPYQCYFEKYTLLDLCCYYGAADCFKFLRTKFNSEITETCLNLSFLGGNQEIMSECMKHQKPDGITMRYAIISHNIDFVTFLVNEYNIEIRLSYCINYNNLESFLVYFDQTNDINKCFINSVNFNFPPLLEYFISLGANINEKDKNGNTALHNVVAWNYDEMAEVLISHGANINIKNEFEKTALDITAARNYKEMAEFLISHGAKINEKTKNGSTALHTAARNNSKEMVEFLISHGAKINEKTKNGSTALHTAARNNSKEMVEFLISHGAKINEKTKNGETALHIAAINNSKETVEVLIAHGANINEKNNNGKTALDLAEAWNYKEMTEILISQ